MSCIRVEVEPTIASTRGESIIREANTFLHIPLKNIQFAQCYTLEAPQEEDKLRVLFQEKLHEVFCDPIMERYSLSCPSVPKWNDATPDFVVEVGFRPGVTDNVARSAEEAIMLLGERDYLVATSSLYYLFGIHTQEQARRIAHELLGNHLIQDIQVWSLDEALHRFDEVQRPQVRLPPTQSLFDEIDMNVQVEDLLHRSKEQCWALNREEVEHIQSYFTQDDALQQDRQRRSLPANPTDVEIEIIAQSWSEHCKHKIFAAHVSYQEEGLEQEFHSLGNMEVSSLFKTYIRAATNDIERAREITWLRSVFHDNAGVVRFDENVDVAIKVETHNSPSALDPYGGAITGILGVNRDILGVGMGARPIANMDVFCFADPAWPLEGDEDEMPVGLLQPRRLLEGVHKGVEDGGNKSGIPTVNGAIFFDKDYAGKPLVFVGTVGVMPQALPDGTLGVHKEISVGDHIMMVGGGIGADGIHGATFSSMELDEHAPATAVQIGDPITQKRVMDFLVEARDLGLFTCLTDNGAGGLSSSVGEMATLSNGARLDLKKAPTKYPGLQPWELMISESQERMTVSVAPEQCAAFLELAQRRGVQATDIGEFTDSGHLDVFYGETRVAYLSLHFLHESLPQMQLTAKWDGSRERKTWIQRDDRRASASLEEMVCTVLSSPNVRSKEPWVRQYDHEVQGATHIKPFGGSTTSGPNDSGVVWLYPHGGDKSSAVSIGCGLAPRLSLHDPYLMAQYAVDEAVRNVVATGGDIDHTCLLDNFCWPDPILSEKTPDGEYKLGQLVRCCAGLYDICTEYGTPLVSGKDSMKNDFRGKNGRGEPRVISILPTLLVTAMSKTTMGATQTSAWKKAGDSIYLLGSATTGLQGTEWAEHFVMDAAFDSVPNIDLAQNHALYRKVFEAHSKQVLSSIHDVSDGGIICSIIESGFGNMLGCSVELDSSVGSLFSEGNGRFVVSVSAQNETAFKEIFANVPHQKLGETTHDPRLVCVHEQQTYFDVALDTLFAHWTKEL